MSPEELVQLGLDAPAPEWPKRTTKATKKAFILGKEAAAKAILDRILSCSGNPGMIFWEVRPKPFSPPHWMVEEK